MASGDWNFLTQKMNRRVRRVDLLSQISDDVMLEHVCRHFPASFLAQEFSRISKDTNRLEESDLFWNVQSQQRLRRKSVLALRHLNKEWTSSKKRFFGLCKLHCKVVDILGDCGNVDYMKKYKSEEALKSVGGSMLDFVNVQLLRKRFCQINDFSFGYYYSHVCNCGSGGFGSVNYVGWRDENGVKLY